MALHTIWDEGNLKLTFLKTGHHISVHIHGAVGEHYWIKVLFHNTKCYQSYEMWLNKKFVLFVLWYMIWYISVNCNWVDTSGSSILCTHTWVTYIQVLEVMILLFLDGTYYNISHVNIASLMTCRAAVFGNIKTRLLNSAPRHYYQIKIARTAVLTAVLLKI